MLGVKVVNSWPLKGVEVVNRDCQNSLQLSKDQKLVNVDKALESEEKAIIECISPVYRFSFGLGKRSSHPLHPDVAKLLATMKVPTSLFLFTDMQ